MKAATNFNSIYQNQHRTFYGAILTFILLLFCSANQAQAAGVSLTATPTSNTVTVGQAVNYTIKINRDAYTDKVTLSATGLPAGTTAVFTPNATTANSSTLSLQTSTTTPIGTFSINVKATATGITIAPITVKLTTTAAPAISLSAFPDSQSIIAGQRTFYDLQINRTGFSGTVVLKAENLPSGVSAWFEPQETDGNTSRMWIYSNGLPPLAQNYELKISARRHGFEVPETTRIVKLKVNCDIAWSYQGFAEYNGSPDFATAVTSDADGNVYAAGHFFPNSGTEVWVAKFTSNGVRIWLRTITLNNAAGLDKRVNAVAVDGARNVYVAGYSLTAGMQVNYDVFVAKFDVSGNQLGQNLLGYSTAEDGKGGAEITFDSAGAAILTAAMNVRRRDISGRTQAFFNINRMSFDFALVTSSNSLPYLAADLIGDPKDLAVGHDNSVYVVGEDLNFNTLSYYGWTMKYGSNGGQIYNQPHNAPYMPTRVAADSSGNAFIAGNISRSTAGVQSYDVWLAKLNSQGSQQWMTFDSTIAEDNIGDLVTDSGGNVIYSGWTRGNLAAANPDGNTDGWLAKRTGAGFLFFQRQFAVVNQDRFHALSLDNAGNALVAGTTVIFNNVNYGFEDVLVIKYSLNPYPFVPFITRPNPSSLRGGTQFTIEGGNFFNVQGIFFDGQPLAYTVISSTQITATAPNVTASRTGNLTVTSDCHQQSSEVQLTVTP